jgi:tetratricopeptide (TPR) repeat protein
MGICQDIDSPATFPLIAAALGTAYTLCGRVADAVPLLTQAIEQPTGRILALYQALPQLSLGEASLRYGRLEEAHVLAARALAHARAHQERGNQAYALRLLGEIAAHQAPLAIESAEHHYQQALTLAEELGMRPLVAHCHHGLGRLYCQTDRHELARTALAAASELYRAMDMTFWLPETKAALARVERQ